MLDKQTLFLKSNDQNLSADLSSDKNLSTEIDKKLNLDNTLTCLKLPPMQLTSDNFYNAISNLCNELRSYSKKGKKCVVVMMDLYFKKEVDFVLEQFEKDIELLKPIYEINFQEAELTLNHLDRLYVLYAQFTNQEDFPFVNIAFTEAFDNLSTYRDSFVDYKKNLAFLDKLYVASKKAIDNLQNPDYRRN